MVDISIVIPTMGQSPSLPEVIGALERQRPELNAEVLVVIDAKGATPASLSTSRSHSPLKLDVLHAQRAGASAARNAGWRAARAPLVLFLDDDIVPRDRLVAEHLAWHSRHPEQEVAVLGNVRWSPRVKVNPFMRWLEWGIQFDFERITGTELGWGVFYSCNTSVKHALLERVGGFDEQQFPFGYEDTELGRRLSEVGLRLLYNREAVGEHLKTETLESWQRNLERIAIAERRYVELYPDEQPYFYQRFSAAADAPVARGRLARLARFVPRRLPWLGPRVWLSHDVVCRQRLAPKFLAAWEAAGSPERPDRHWASRR
jgi:GT2 family glycosyltransferase